MKMSLKTPNLQHVMIVLLELNVLAVWPLTNAELWMRTLFLLTQTVLLLSVAPPMKIEFLTARRLPAPQVQIVLLLFEAPPVKHEPAIAMADLVVHRVLFFWAGFARPNANADLLTEMLEHVMQTVLFLFAVECELATIMPSRSSVDLVEEFCKLTVLFLLSSAFATARLETSRDRLVSRVRLNFFLVRLLPSAKLPFRTCRVKLGPLGANRVRALSRAMPVVKLTPNAPLAAYVLVVVRYDAKSP